jgi:hypothetical protein
VPLILNADASALPVAKASAAVAIVNHINFFMLFFRLYLFGFAPDYALIFIIKFPEPLSTIFEGKMARREGGVGRKKNRAGLKRPGKSYLF